VSVERLPRKRGVGWRVRWREGDRNRARTFDRKSDALAFEAEIRRAKRVGDLPSLDAGRETLQEFAEEWWQLHAAPDLAPTTLASYAALWDKHVLPRLGAIKLRDLNSEVVARFRADLTKAGLRDSSVRKVLAILQSVLQRAVEWQRIPSNPCAAVRKPSQRRERVVRPVTPEQVERMRRHLLDRGRMRDAVFVSALAYAGLRPGEALALTWGDVRKRTILVERSLALGQIKRTKTERTRTVRLLVPLAADLAELRLARGRPADDGLVFPSTAGSTWSDVTWRNWRRRVFAPAARAAALETNARPYDLRHSFVSLLLAEGATVVEVARQAGHSPSVTLSTYAHLFEELEGTERHSAEDEIRRAREAIRSSRTRFVPESETGPTTPEKKTPAKPEKPTPGLEPGTPSLRVSGRRHHQSPGVTSGHSLRRIPLDWK
jgi:integrase